MPGSFKILWKIDEHWVDEINLKVSAPWPWQCTRICEWNHGADTPSALWPCWQGALVRVKGLKFGFDSFSLSQLEGVSAWSLHLKAEAQLCQWWGVPLTAMDGRDKSSYSQHRVAVAWDLLGRDLMQLWLLSQLLILSGLWHCWPKLPLVPPSLHGGYGTLWFHC